jgi:hypothetical protein
LLKKQDQVAEGVPSFIIQPEHGRAHFTKVPLGRGDRFFRRIAIEDSFVYADDHLWLE